MDRWERAKKVWKSQNYSIDYCAKVDLKLFQFFIFTFYSRVEFYLRNTLIDFFCCRSTCSFKSRFSFQFASSSLNFPLWRTADRLVDRKIRTFVLEFYSGFHFTQSIFFLHTELSKLFASKSMETNSLLTEEREYRFKKCNRLWLRKIHKIGCHRSFFFPSLRVSREKFIPQLFRIYNLSWLVKGDRQTHIQHSTFHSALIFFLSDINEKFPFSSVH